MTTVSIVIGDYSSARVNAIVEGGALVDLRLTRLGYYTFTDMIGLRNNFRIVISGEGWRKANAEHNLEAAARDIARLMQRERLAGKFIIYGSEVFTDMFHEMILSYFHGTDSIELAGAL